MVKRVLKTIVFIILGIAVLFGIAILYDNPPAVSDKAADGIHKFMEFTDGFGLIIGHGLRLLTQFFP